MSTVTSTAASPIRFARSIALALLCVVALSACCAGSTCIKDPPCKPCENPCCPPAK